MPVVGVDDPIFDLISRSQAMIIYIYIYYMMLSVTLDFMLYTFISERFSKKDRLIWLIFLFWVCWKGGLMRYECLRLGAFECECIWAVAGAYTYTMPWYAQIFVYMYTRVTAHTHSYIYNSSIIDIEPYLIIPQNLVNHRLIMWAKDKRKPLHYIYIYIYIIVYIAYGVDNLHICKTGFIR